MSESHYCAIAQRPRPAVLAAAQAVQCCARGALLRHLASTPEGLQGAELWRRVRTSLLVLARASPIYLAWCVATGLKLLPFAVALPGACCLHQPVWLTPVCC